MSRCPWRYLRSYPTETGQCPHHETLEPSQSFGFGVDLTMAGLAEHLAVRQFVIAARGHGLLVVELSRPGATSAVVRA